jgi:uncharacterized RDD family membrane protein YckC
VAYPVQDDPTSVVGRRVLAAIIDLALVLVPMMLIVTSQFEYVDAGSLPVTAEQFCDDRLDDRGGFCVNADGVDGRVYFADDLPSEATVFWWVANIGMFVVLQGLTGWTIGKLLLGIRTVREDGRAAGMGKALVRRLLWIVDGFPYFLPLVGFIVALTSTGHRRVGDMAAKTFVVRKAAMGSPIIVPGLTAPPVMEPAVAGAWGASAPPVGTPPGQPAVDRPQWDEARGTNIQWDPVEQSWMQWDEGQHTWLRIPGQ